MEDLKEVRKMKDWMAYFQKNANNNRTGDKSAPAETNICPFTGVWSTSLDRNFPPS